MNTPASTKSPVPDTMGVGLRFVTAVTLQKFRVDREALGQWLTESDYDDCDGGPQLPFRFDDRPAATLASLIADAVEASAIVGDDRLELLLHSDDDCYGSGIFVLVRNTGDTNHLSLTSGWQELWWYDESDLDEAGRVLKYLESVCAEANQILDVLERCALPKGD